MKIKLLILDFDGTMADTRDNIVKTFRMALAEEGLPAVSEDACAATIGLTLQKAFPILCPGISEQKAESCVDTYRRIFAENKKILMPRLYPHVMETLARLERNGLEMSIASSRSTKSLIEFGAEMGFDRYIHCMVGAQDVEHTKPEPDAVIKILSDLGYRPGDALVIGDTKYDILMGRGAGTYTCGVTYGIGTRGEIVSSRADFIIDSFDGLCDIAGCTQA